MQSYASTLEAAGSLDPAVSQLLAAKDQSIAELTVRVEALSRQVDWYRRQMFGSKSERLVLQDNPRRSRSVRSSIEARRWHRPRSAVCWPSIPGR